MTAACVANQHILSVPILPTFDIIVLSFKRTRYINYSVSVSLSPYVNSCIIALLKCKQDTDLIATMNEMLFTS